MLKLLPVAALCLSLPAMAYSDYSDREKRKGEPRFRVSAGMAQGEIKDSYATYDDTGFTVELSGEFNPYVGINFEMAQYSESIDVLNHTFDIDLATYAANLDIGYTFNDRSNFEVKPFVALGIIRHDMDYVPGENAFSYGVGIRTTAYDWLTLSLEAEFAEFDLYDSEVVSLKLGYRY